MDSNELTSLVVRLMGDGTSYMAMIQQAQAATVQASATIASATARIEAFGAGLRTFSSGALGALGALGISTGFSSAFSKFADGEKLMLRLSAAIVANGRAAEDVTKDYLKFSDQMAALTLTTKGQALQMLKQAESMGVMGEAAKNAVKNAISLSGAADVDATSLMRVAIALETNNIAVLKFAGRMIPALRGIHDETQLVAKAQELIRVGWQVATKESETVSGSLQRLKNNFAEITKYIGELVSKVMKPFVDTLLELSKQFKALDADMKRTVATTFALFGAIVGFGSALAFLGPFKSLLLGPFKALAGLLTGMPTLWTAIAGPMSIVLRLATALAPVLLSLLNPVQLLRIALFGVVGAVTTLASAISFVFSPWIIGSALVLGGLAAMVDRVGGLIKVWDAVKEAASRAWDWLKPVRDEVNHLILVVRTVGGDMWAKFKDTALQAWSAVFSTVSLDWEAVRTKAVSVIRAISDFIQVRVPEAIAFARDRAVGAWEVVRDTGVAAWGKLTDAVSYAADKVAEFAEATYGWAKNFVQQNADAIFSITSMATAVLASYGAYRGFIALLGLVRGAIALLHIQQVINAAMWVAWTGLVLAAKGVMLVYSAALAVVTFAVAAYNGVMTFAGFVHTLVTAAITSTTVATGTWTVASVAAKVATWLLSAAFGGLAASITSVNLAAIVPILVAAGLAATALYIGLVAVGSALYAAYETSKGLYEALAGMASVGAFSAITKMLGEWWSYIKLIVDAVQIDLTLAWSIAKASLAVAVAQIKALWPPLWEFLRTSFDFTWVFIANSLEARFTQALLNVTGKFFSFFTKLDPSGILAGKLEEAMAELNKGFNKSIDAEIKNLETGLKLAAKKFAMGTRDLDTEEVKKAKEELARLTRELEAAKARQKQIPPLDTGAEQAAKDAAKAGEAVGKEFKKAVEAEKIDAALFSSAEALSRIAAYKEKLNAANTAANSIAKAAGSPSSPGRPGEPGLSVPQPPAALYDSIKTAATTLSAAATSLVDAAKTLKDLPAFSGSQFQAFTAVVQFIPDTTAVFAAIEDIEKRRIKVAFDIEPGAFEKGLFPKGTVAVNAEVSNPAKPSNNNARIEVLLEQIRELLKERQTVLLEAADLS